MNIDSIFIYFEEVEIMEVINKNNKFLRGKLKLLNIAHLTSEEYLFDLGFKNKIPKNIEFKNITDFKILLKEISYFGVYNIDKDVSGTPFLPSISSSYTYIVQHPKMKQEDIVLGFVVKILKTYRKSKIKEEKILSKKNRDKNCKIINIR